MATAFDSATGYAAVDANGGEGQNQVTTTLPTVTDLVERMWPDETY
jgi:hypothetical protein